MAVSAKHDEFNHWWATEGDWVEEPNYRRNGMSGVKCVDRNGNLSAGCTISGSGWWSLCAANEG